MALSPSVTYADGTTGKIDFVSAMSSAIANLGNIGPSVTVGNVNAGPSGNYSSFSGGAKIVMIILMFVGRVGVLTILIMFITDKGEKSINQEIAKDHFDSTLPTHLK